MTAVTVGDQTVEVRMQLAKRHHGWESFVFSPMTQSSWLLRVKAFGPDFAPEYIAELYHEGEIYDLPVSPSRAHLRLNVARVVLGFEPIP